MATISEITNNEDNNYYQQPILIPPRSLPELPPNSDNNINQQQIKIEPYQQLQPLKENTDINKIKEKDKDAEKDEEGEGEIMAKKIIDALTNNLSAPILKGIANKLEKTVESLSEDCTLSHLVSQLSSHGINYSIVKQIKDLYDDHSNRKVTERYDRIFESFCSPCTFLKFGLLSENIEKQLPLTSCGLRPTRHGNTRFNMGPFIHGRSTFTIDKKLYPDMDENITYSESIAFPKGVIVIPDSKIIMQVLAMNANRICNGVKICMINSDEENITNSKIYVRFLARNGSLNCGYYVRDKSVNIKDLNKKSAHNIKFNSSDNVKHQLDDNLISHLEEYQNENNTDNKNGRGVKRKLKIKMGPLKTTKTYESDESSDSDVENIDNPYYLYIKSVDSKKNFKSENIFQNGEPLKYVLPTDDPYDPEDICMRVFDFNPVLITYFRTMFNIQGQVDKDYEIKNNKINYNFLDEQPHLLSQNRLITHTFYDFMSLAFLGELNQENLMKIPPFNKKCILGPSNILFINKHGNAIMVSDFPKYSSECASYNYLLKLMEDSPINHKLIATTSNTNLTYSGNVPKAKFSSEAIKDLYKSMVEYDKIIINDDDNNKLMNQDTQRNKDFIEQRTDIFKEVHTKLKNSTDIFKSYFYEFNDDINEKVNFKGKEFVYDTARKIYPHLVLNAKNNKKQQTLDFSVKHGKKSVVDEIPPNIVYVNNLGFVSLSNICNGSPLILKNSTVYLQNLYNRFTKNKNALFVQSSGDCSKRGDEDGDDDNMIVNTRGERVMTMPIKSKMSDNTVNLVGEESEFDHMGHIRRKDCVGPTVNQYIDRYSRDNSNCLGSI